MVKEDINKNGDAVHGNWETPAYIYDPLDDEFHFDFDPCPINADFDGLEVDWGISNFVNPPYYWIIKQKFIRKAYEESLNGKLSVLLLPVSTATKIFHEVILPNAEVRFVQKRIKFIGRDRHGNIESEKSGRFDSMIVIFRPVAREHKEDKHDG